MVTVGTSPSLNRTLSIYRNSARAAYRTGKGWIQGPVPALLESRLSVATDPTQSSQPGRRVETARNRSAWPLATVLIVAIVTAAGLYLTFKLSQVPRDAFEGSRKLVGELQQVARAFKSGTVETSFFSFATSIEGSSHLQFATVERTEVFTLTDRSSVFWGAVDLPDVVVSATAPVTYTAYLDLDDHWDFMIEGSTIDVTAPRIRFNKPSIDASRIRYEVRQDSLLRDEDAALQALKSALTEMSIRRAEELRPAVRETGRRRTEHFVSTWLVRSFADGGDFRVRVRFADEPIPPTTDSLGAED